MSHLSCIFCLWCWCFPNDEGLHWYRNVLPLYWNFVCWSVWKCYLWYLIFCICIKLCFACLFKYNSSLITPGVCGIRAITMILSGLNSFNFWYLICIYLTAIQPASSAARKEMSWFAGLKLSLSGLKQINKMLKLTKTSKWQAAIL